MDCHRKLTGYDEKGCVWEEGCVCVWGGGVCIELVVEHPVSMTNVHSRND